MAVDKPTPLEQVPRVSDKAVDLAARITENDITKFRFKFGGFFIGSALVVFLLGHFVPVAQYFTTDFPEHAWTITKIMLCIGSAFSGREVIEALASGLKNIFGKPG